MVARVQRVNGLIHRDILVGVFCLWVSLTILGVVGLNNIGQGVISSVSLKIGAAPGIALMVSIIIRLCSYRGWLSLYWPIC
jgi:hypothetical protein